MNRIYLDYAASTPVAPEVLKAMQPYFLEKYGNPSSMHSFGREAEIAIDEARELVASFFEVDFSEVYFTSGATEADNWIVHALAATKLPEKQKPHIVISAIEHEAIRDICLALEKRGIIELSLVQPQRSGHIEVADVQAALKKNTVLVSIIYVNNEIGSVQPIREIGKMLEKAREQSGNGIYPIFHTDAVQAIQFFESRPDYIKVDALTISGHKIYGPKGIGALIAKQHVPIEPLLYGGGQEGEKRSGTQNVPAIVGFARALELLTSSRAKEAQRLEALRKTLTEGLKKSKLKLHFTCNSSCAPHILSVIVKDIEAQVLLIALDQEGVAISSGSACSAKALKPSRVLLSCGYSQDQAFSGIRFSMGKPTTLKEVQKAGELFCKVGEQLTKR